MAILSYNTITNLENSLNEFIDLAILNDSLQVIADGQPRDVIVRVGNKVDTNWSLPVIQIYSTSKTSPRLEIGSNKRLKGYLMIIDIRADSGFNRDNLADWLSDQINDGFPFYEYTANGSNPTKVQNGRVAIDFVTDQKVNLGDDVDLFDKYRWRITINCFLNK